MTACTVVISGQRSRGLSGITMSDITSWVSDQLHVILGLSDRFVAEYMVGLARKSSSPETLECKLQETNTITVNPLVRKFISELWKRVPHKQVVEKSARVHEREILLQQQRNKSYRLLSESDDEEIPTKSVKASRARKKSIEVSKKRRNIRKEKASTWESESDGEEGVSLVKKSKEESDDEWDRQVVYPWLS